MDDNVQQWKQDTFSRGLIKNAPHDDLPPSSVAGLVNAHCYDTEVQPRLASWLYSELQPPAWEDDCSDALTGYTLSRDGNVVTRDRTCRRGSEPRRSQGVVRDSGQTKRK